MKVKTKLLVGAVCCFIITATAQKPVLEFRSDGKFKIAQIADPHYHEDKVQRLKTIGEMLDTEKPDLVVYTGDFVNADCTDLFKDLDTLFNLCISREILWAFTLGNHDDEHAVSREKVAHYIVSMPFCVGEIGPENIGGYGNYTLEIKNKDANTPAFLLYCFDNAYQPEGFEAKGWVTFEQLSWYRTKSAAYTAANGGKPLPAIAFFHIPLDEYVWISTNPKKSKMLGDKGEKECLGVLNSGLFQSFHDCKDVFATFCGHDHLNDYIGEYHGITLAYGRSSCQIKVIGSRLIEISAVPSQPRLTTWLRLADGSKINEYIIP